MEPLIPLTPVAFLAEPPSLWQVIGLVLAIVVAIALTILVILGMLSLITVGSIVVLGKLRRLLFPALAAKDDAFAVQHGDTTLKKVQAHVPFFRERHIAHKDIVVSLAISENGKTVVSAGRDETLHVWERDIDRQQTIPLPFFPGPLAAATHATRGLQIVLGVFRKDLDKHAPDLLLWEPATAGMEPTLRLSVPQIRTVHTLVWNADAERLRVLASVYDPSLPPAPNGDLRTPNHLSLMEFAMGLAASHEPIPLTLPPDLDNMPSWTVDDSSLLALSRNGRWLACRIVRPDAGEERKRHGIGVWDVDRGGWRHRFGGCEAEPHEIRYVTEDGDQVFSTREDEPGRDFHVGGPEWYDGVYVWDMSSPPEGTEEARPHPTMHGGAGMVMNRTETLSTQSTSTGEVDICDVPTRTLRQTLKRPPTNDPAHPYGSNVWGQVFSDATSEIITGHADGQLWVWELSASPDAPS